MTPKEITQVLAKAASYDRRTVGAADVLAWHEILGRYDLGGALEAVTRHYADSREWIMPADVVRHIRTIRDQRQRDSRHAVRALPSRYETDPERDARIAAHIRAIRQDLAARRTARHAADDRD
jgi:hypothetical protein